MAEYLDRNAKIFVAGHQGLVGGCHLVAPGGCRLFEPHESLSLIEVQTGDYLEEDDIVGWTTIFGAPLKNKLIP
jgi:hypothetical protein